MKFAICNETYEGWAFEKSFSHARELGYTGIEIAPFTLDYLTPNVIETTSQQRKTVRRIAETNDLEVIGLHWLLAKTNGLHVTTDDADVRKKTADYFCDLARLCGDLGGKIMVFGSPQQRNLVDGVSPEAGFERAVALFQDVAPTLEKLDITIALEPLGPAEGNFLLTSESAIEMATAIDSPHVKLHLDVKAMSSESKPIADIIRDSREWLVHFHANDPNLLGPGMGEMDYTPIAAALNEIQYDRWVSVEVFDYSPGAEKITSESLAYLNRIWESSESNG